MKLLRFHYNNNYYKSKSASAYYSNVICILLYLYSIMEMSALQDKKHVIRS